MLLRANAIRMIQAGLVIGDAGSDLAATRPERLESGPRLRWFRVVGSVRHWVRWRNQTSCRILRRDSSIFGGAWSCRVPAADYLSSRRPISVRGFHLGQASC
jgi:hypothetical protein